MAQDEETGTRSWLCRQARELLELIQVPVVFQTIRSATTPLQAGRVRLPTQVQ